MRTTDVLDAAAAPAPPAPPAAPEPAAHDDRALPVSSPASTSAVDDAKRIRAAWHARKQRLPRRGLASQRQAREAALRERQAASLSMATTRGILDRKELALLYDASPRTLRRWSHASETRTLTTTALGRRAKRGSADARKALLQDLAANPRMGVPTLRLRHRMLGRREIEDLRARTRLVRTTRERDIVRSLTWSTPGTVWAVDFSDAGLDIDGTFPCLLLVRDLATGYEILTLPCRRQDGLTVRAALCALLTLEGPPLVLKADNGGCFVADAVADVLDAHGVLLLRSPKYTPEFNGSREAAGGWLKTRAHHIAAAYGRERSWSCDDVEAARCEANDVRPGGPQGPTRAERWRARVPVAPELRAAFRADVAQRLAEARTARDLGADAVLDDDTTQAIARAAIGGSLRAHRLLSDHPTSIPARRGPRRTDRRRGKPEEVTSSN